jgi:hypothetical protein
MRIALGVALSVCALVIPAPVTAAPHAHPDRIVAAAWVEGAYSITGALGYRDRHFTLYADGRLITPGAPDTHGVETLRRASLASAASREMRQALLEATAGVEFGDVPVADVGYTRTRVSVDGQVAHARVNALLMTLGLPDAQRRARERLVELIDSWKAIPSAPFTPAAYEVQIRTVSDPMIQLEWPGPPLPTRECARVSARTYAMFPATFQQGNAYTWRGKSLTVWVRPLLPGESGCPGR